MNFLFFLFSREKLDATFLKAYMKKFTQFLWFKTQLFLFNMFVIMWFVTCSFQLFGLGSPEGVIIKWLSRPGVISLPETLIKPKTYSCGGAWLFILFFLHYLSSQHQAPYGTSFDSGEPCKSVCLNFKSTFYIRFVKEWMNLPQFL